MNVFSKYLLAGCSPTASFTTARSVANAIVIFVLALLALAVGARPANAGAMFADTVLAFFDSGAGPLAGPYGGISNGSSGVSVPLSYATDGDANTFVSLPTSSFLTLGFTTGFVFDGPGLDLFISEVGAASETADVYVSANFGDSFTFLGTTTAATYAGLDLASINFPGLVNAVKIIGLDNRGASPGFDLAFVQGVEGSVSFTFDYTAGTGNWSSGMAWAGRNPPAGLMPSISFSGTGGVATNDGRLANVTGMTFTPAASGAYVVSGSALLVGGGMANNSSFVQTIQTNLTATSAVTVAASAGAIVLSGSIDTAGHELTLRGEQPISLAVVSGGGSLVKSDGGVALLNGVVSTDTVSMTGGTLRLGTSNRLSDSTVLAMSGSGTFDLSGGTDTIGSLSMSGNSSITNGTLTAATYALGGGTISGNLGGGTLTNTGVTSLNGSAAVSVLNVNSGTLTLGSAGRLTNNPAVTGSSSAVLVLGGAETIGSLSGNADVSLGSSELTVGSDGTSTTYTGRFSGSGRLTKTGNGSLTLTGSNSFTGGTTISGGTLALGNANALGSSTTALAMNAGTLNIGGFNLTIGALSGSAGAVVTTSTSAATRTLTTNVASGASTYAGTIADNGAGKLSLTKAGAGTLTLSGSNSFTGATVLSAGVLALESVGALGSTGTITFTGGTLQYSAANTTDYSVRFGTGQSIRIDTNGQAVTFASALSGTSGLIKIGKGLLTLSGNNTYTGQTIVAGGTLQIGGGGTTGAIFGNVINNASLSFNRTTASTYTGVISGSGAVIQNGGGSLTLGGSNSFSGGTILDAGSLVAMNRSAFGTGAVVVNSGTLNLASLAISNQITNNGGTIINAANYGGTQSVAGVVSMTGTIGGTVNVSPTGELKGNGAVFNGPVTLATGAQHSPGSSPGSQTFTAGLAYSAGASLNWELIANTTTGAGTNYDFLSVTGGGLSIASGALLNLVFSGSGSMVSWSDPFWSADRSWTIIDASAAASSTGEFLLGTISTDSLGQSLGAVRPRASFALDQSGSDVVLTFNAVPEPSTYAMALAGIACGGFSMWRRRTRSPKDRWLTVAVWSKDSPVNGTSASVARLMSGS